MAEGDKILIRGVAAFLDISGIPRTTDIKRPQDEPPGAVSFKW